MPIKGLTDRGAAFPCIGELRKGGEKVDDRRPGADLTYFRFTSKEPELVDLFRQLYGDEPNNIDIVLPYATALQNFDPWNELWVRGGLKHRCDGEVCTVWQDEAGAYQRSPIPCPGGCKPAGRLSVVIPDLKRLATVTVLTSSVNDILMLQRSLQAIEAITKDLRGIPFVLSRKPKKISRPSNNGTRQRVEKYLINIEPSPAWVGMQLQGMQRLALAAGNVPLEEEHNEEVIEAESQIGELPSDVSSNLQGDESSSEVSPVADRCAALINELAALGHPTFKRGDDRRERLFTHLKTFVRKSGFNIDIALMEGMRDLTDSELELYATELERVKQDYKSSVGA